jgi:hypothetical protein
MRWERRSGGKEKKEREHQAGTDANAYEHRLELCTVSIHFHISIAILHFDRFDQGSCI